MKSILALIAVALALTSVSALACDGSGNKMKGADSKGRTTALQRKKGNERSLPFLFAASCRQAPTCRCRVPAGTLHGLEAMLWPP